MWMPQPLPISKRKTQNHLTTNKNINKHRTNMFVFMSKKKKKNHTFVCCQPHLFYLMLYIEDYTKKDKKCVNLSSTRLFFIKKIFNWKNVFIPKKVCHCHQFIKKTILHLKTFRASRITTIPNLDLTYLDIYLYLLLLLSFFFVCVS